MKSVVSYLFLFLSLCVFLQAHEGHQWNIAQGIELNAAEAKNSDFWAVWLPAIGRFHLIFLHFPIALIVMTVAAEVLWIWFANPLFAHAARFMLLAAAIFALPTALLGLALSYGQTYEGIKLDLFVWHRYFGIITAGLAIIAAIMRERYVREHATSVISYYICLLFLFICVSLTGAFGGSLAFGLDVW